mmetsp:Transcript_76228/g.228750  ORF Transcript_76228/g.228750 Transcript_76228/m.228750 type:complete len:253 (-) Transcript_76228:194-952(-)
MWHARRHRRPPVLCHRRRLPAQPRGLRPWVGRPSRALLSRVVGGRRRVLPIVRPDALRHHAARGLALHAALPIRVVGRAVGGPLRPLRARPHAPRLCDRRRAAVGARRRASARQVGRGGRGRTLRPWRATAGGGRRGAVRRLGAVRGRDAGLRPRARRAACRVWRHGWRLGPSRDGGRGVGGVAAAARGAGLALGRGPAGGGVERRAPHARLLGPARRAQARRSRCARHRLNGEGRVSARAGGRAFGNAHPP